MKTSELALLACVLLAFATQASPGLYEDRSFSVTGTNFFFKFQDTGLDTSNMTRIAEDIIAIRGFGITGEVRHRSANGHDGYIYNNNLCDSPYYQNDMVEFPRDFDTLNSTNYLFIPKCLSDAYTNSFSFLDTNTNIYNSALLFIDSLATNRLDLIPSNQIWRIVYYRNAEPATYTLARDEIVNELKQQRYGFPSALSFQQTGPGTNGFPHAATWMRVPCKHWSSLDRDNVFSIFFAVWHDGIWRLYPTEW